MRHKCTVFSEKFCSNIILRNTVLDVYVNKDGMLMIVRLRVQCSG